MKCLLLLVVSASICWLLAMSKKRKDRDPLELTSLGRASYASKSAIASLLAHVSEHGIPETYDRTSQFRARKEVSRESRTEYGPLVVDLNVPLAKGGETKLSFQNPLAFVCYHAKHSPHFTKILSDAVQRHPPSPTAPWRLIIYQDGIDPSDGLAKNHSRKSAVFYFAYVEYGMVALSHEQCWGTLVVARHSEHTKFAGGVQMLFQKCLELFHGDVHDIMRSGMSVEFPNARRVTIFAKTKVILGDIPALKECLACKGHAGVVCCPLCVNAVQHNSQSIPFHVLVPGAVSIAETTFDAFIKHDNDSIRRAVQKIDGYYSDLKANRIKAAEFEERCIALGWNHSEANVILNPKFGLDVATSTMLDWAHIYVHDGLADTEFGQVMKIMHSNRAQTSFAEVGEYISNHVFPKSAPGVKHLFSDAANTNNAKKGSFSCTGSEFITIAPVLHRYFDRVVRARGQLMPYVLSFLAVLEVVILLTAVRSGCVTADELTAAIIHHLELYVAAYGPDCTRPKHHYALHLGPLLRFFKFLLATFTHERKHRLIMRYGKDRKNLRSFEAGTIEEICCHQIFEMQQPFFLRCRVSEARGRILVPLQEMLPDIAKFSILNCISCNGGSCSAGDVVTCHVDGQMHVGELLLSFGYELASGPVIESVIALWTPVNPAQFGQSWCDFVVAGDRVVRVVTDMSIDTVLTYRMAADKSSCTVFLPPEIRSRA